MMALTYRGLLILPLLVVVSIPEGAQSTLADSSSGDSSGSLHDRKLASTLMIGTVVTGSLLESYYSWWHDAAKPFTFYTENWLSKGRGIDKIGHLYGSYFFFHMSREIMLYGGHDESTADWWGLGLSFFHSLTIEIGDGVSPYGFDYQDLLFDMAGIGYGYLQTKDPFFRNFNLKFSYWSSQGLKSPANFTKDYDALTIWLSFNVHNLLPYSVKSYWPDFLQLAVGYGVDDRATKAEVAFALDLNLEVFSIKNEELALLQKIGNMIHVPAPGIKFTESKKPRSYFFLMR